MSETINLTVKVWRQKGPETKGHMETYEAKEVSTDMSFLEMLDVINEDLTLQGKDPIAFDHDCREGICGSCGGNLPTSRRRWLRIWLPTGACRRL